jgi:hypothetical protein
VTSVASTKIGSGVAAVLLALSLAAAGTAGAAQRFRPRVHGAFGLIPRQGGPEITSGANSPVVYHGGSVMRDVTVHTIFWAPSGYHFDGAPGLLTLPYEAEIQQFLTDVATDSRSTSNVFSVLPQYGDGSGPGSYHLSYSAGADSIDSADPYPAKNDQCASPAGVDTCITDLQLQQEIDKQIAAHDPAGRGLHDLWFIFLPPDVDQCITPGVCDSNSFAGYHSLANVGNGPVIYASVPDPLVEGPSPQGADPQGNPEAENALDTVAHEAIEAITDPEGTAWMDPNGFEVGDDCELPELGTPLGYALDGSPYNQVINGHQYLFQMMWSNAVNGCVQRSTATTSPLPLATVSISQFSSRISGNTGVAKPGIGVDVGLLRAGDLVAGASARTNAGGDWSATLGGRVRHAFGDDRDVIIVSYGRGGPLPDLIATGSGGNPFTESGWTGFFDLDHGYAVGDREVLLGPCSQTGVLGLTIGRTSTPPPVEQCETETDVSAIQTGPITARTRLTMSSEDNRGNSPQNPDGALVKLTIPLGEPFSSSTLGNPDVLFNPTGFPLCTANLEAQSVVCTGLVPGSRYTLTRHRGDRVAHTRADFAGTARITRAGVRGGDVISLRNSAGRTLTTLHVAHLRVRVVDQQTVLSGGTCEPGDYYGKPITAPPTGTLVGVGGAADTGTVCPGDGRAAGLPAGDIEQTDDLSGGSTRTELVGVASLAPNNGATLYGPFVASAQPALYGFNGSIYNAPARVSLSVRRLGAKHRALFVANVAVGHGVRINALPQGVYAATWVVTNVNGDTVTVHTRFVEA